MEKAVVVPSFHRERVYDVLRGVAILGILLANMEAFRGPMLGMQMGLVDKDSTGVARIIDLLTTVFVNGKFRAMLGMLFGVGLWLQYSRRSHDPALWPGGYLKRTLFLGVLGLMHSLFIWYGDILFTYSAVAFVACFLASQSDRVLKMIIGIGAVLLVLCGGAFAALMGWLGSLTDPGETGKAGSDGFLQIFDPKFELAVYQSGTWFEQVAHRVQTFFIGSLPSAVFFVPLMLPLFLLGVLLARHRVLLQPSAFPKVRNACLLFGFGLGLPLNAIAFTMWESGDLIPFRMLNEFGFGGFLAVGYLMLGAVAVEKGWLRPVQNLFEKVGRVALTNYLLQSVLCTAIFYSWGGGQFGRMSTENSLLVVLGVWVVCIVFSILWLKRFTIGPVEWAWRSATEGRKLPWTREGMEAIKAPPKEEARPQFDV